VSFLESLAGNSARVTLRPGETATVSLRGR